MHTHAEQEHVQEVWWRICPSDRQYLRRSERASERASEYIGTKYPSPVRASEPSGFNFQERKLRGWQPLRRPP